MFNDSSQFIDIIMAASAFGLVLALWIGGVLVWAGRKSARTKRLGRRLGLGHDGKGAEGGERVLSLWHDGQEATTTVPGTAHAGSIVERLGDESRRAGLSLSGTSMLLLVIALVGAGFVATYFLTSNALLGLGVAIACFVIFRIWQQHRISQREHLFEGQLVEAMGLAARSLRAGHPLLGALQLVSEEMKAPVKPIFAEICQKHALGSDLETVLRDVAHHATNADLKLFATSVAIQVRSGGNLAGLMDRLSTVIRQRIRLGRRVRILTAQTQLSKRVLLTLPFILFLVLNILNPDYMRPFYTSLAGQVMLAAGVAMLAAGAWVMNRMATLKY